MGSFIGSQGQHEWAQCISNGRKILEEQEADFDRPPATSHKLYMAIGEKDVIEVAHPTPSNSECVPLYNKINAKFLCVESEWSQGSI